MSLDTRDRQLGSGKSTFGDAFYPLYRLLFDEEDDFVQTLEKKLAQARMADNVEMFISRALAVGVIAGFVLWLLGLFVGYLFVQMYVEPGSTLIGLPFPESLMPIVNALKAPFLMLVAGLFLGSIGFAIGFGSLISIPYFRASARKREMNVLLSDSISFMYALSVGGMNQLEILQAMAKADDTYGEVAKEFQSIVLETEYFDTDYRTAIRNQALETPSDELAQFLTDMLSIVDSGGDMTAFLEDQKDKHMRTAKQEQKKLLDTLELFGEMYMTLSLFPLLLIIILVIMSMMGQAQTELLYGTVYGLIPLIGVGFLVLVSTVTQDRIGDGYLRPGRDEEFTVQEGIGVFNPSLVEQYTGEHGIFDRIKRREGTHELMEILRAPHIFFRDHPRLVLAVTIPISMIAFLMAMLAIILPEVNVVAANLAAKRDVASVGFLDAFLGWMIGNPVRSTFILFYVPLYINFVPLAIFYEWNVRSRRAILGNLSENLRKLASANDTGMTLLESIKVVSETSSGKLADEFETMHAKVNYGTDLKSALREFNNKYHIPRLARTVKLISEAQEASSQIQDVLSTAAKSSENQDDIDRERVTRTRMQVVIIIMTYLTLLGVMALLKLQFLNVMSGLAEQTAGTSSSGPTSEFGGNVDTGLLSLLFFHAVFLQALVSSFIAGYIRNIELISGVKYAVALSTVALFVWIIVNQISSGGEEAALLLLFGSVGRPLWGRRPTSSSRSRSRESTACSSARDGRALERSDDGRRRSRRPIRIGCIGPGRGKGRRGGGGD